jgi:hypothetical protein
MGNFWIVQLLHSVSNISTETEGVHFLRMCMCFANVFRSFAAENNVLLTVSYNVKRHVV